MAGKGEPPRLSYAADLLRSLFATGFLVLATWNPSGTSYFDWLRRGDRPAPVLVAAGIALTIGHVAVTRMAWAALGAAGLLASVTVVASALLAASRLGLADLPALAAEPVSWLMLWAVLLAIGLTWAKIQKRVSGQRDVLKYPP